MPETGAEDGAAIVAWLKRPGEAVAEEEALCLVGWSGGRAAVASPAAGVLRMIALGAGTSVATGTSLAVIDVGVAARPRSDDPGLGAPSSNATPADVPAELVRDAPAEPGEAVDLGGFLSPAVRRFARENGIDPAALEGTGRDGRVTLADLSESS